MEIAPETKERIAELQKLEQQLQVFSNQRQQFHNRLIEIENAKKELERLPKDGKAYKMVGNIMVLSEKDELSKDLESKHEVLSLRVKTLEKQEEKIKEKLDALQENLMKELKKKEGKEHV